MLRRSPRAVLLWAAALVVAIVTATSVGGTLASLHRQDNRYGRVRAVVVAAHLERGDLAAIDSRLRLLQDASLKIRRRTGCALASIV